MSAPLISVVVPTCHRDDLLARCLERLAPGRQTLSTDFYEVIVTDDGVSGTAEAMLASRFPWATWNRGPRRGPAANRNSGARPVCGEWIAFTDDDCLPGEGWLSAFKLAMGSGMQVYEGKTTCSAGFDSPLVEAPVNLNGGNLWSCNMMIGKDLFQRLGGFDERFPLPWAEDIDLRERIKHAGHKTLFVPDAVVDHPPRRRRWGKRSAALWECRVLLWYKQGNNIPAQKWLPGHAFKVRLHQIIKAPLGKDSVLALGGMIEEYWWILHWVKGWDQKYNALAKTGGTALGRESCQ